MKTHLKRIARQKVSDFLLREEGMIGNRTGFATAAFVGATSLAMTLLIAPDAEAEKWCPGANHGDYCWDDELCCWNRAQGRNADYRCVDSEIDGWNCW